RARRPSSAASASRERSPVTSAIGSSCGTANLLAVRDVAVVLAGQIEAAVSLTDGLSAPRAAGVARQVRIRPAGSLAELPRADLHAARARRERQREQREDRDPPGPWHRAHPGSLLWRWAFSRGQTYHWPTRLDPLSEAPRPAAESA